MSDIELNKLSDVTLSCKSTAPSIVSKPKLALRDLSSVFFDPVIISRDNTFRSPLCTAADVLSQQGLNHRLTKYGLLTLLTLCSARLGYSSCLVLVDETTSTAQSLLSLIKPLMPKQAVIECMSLSTEKLYLAAEDLKSKTIINPDYNGLKNVKTDLEHLVEHGYVSRQEKIISKFKKGLELLEITGPVSVLTVCNDPSNSDWKGSSVLKVFINPDDACSDERQINADALHVETCRIAKSFERLQVSKVEIPFMEDIQSKIRGSNILVTENMIKPLKYLISIIAIINNPPPFLEDEIIAAVYGVEKERLRNWLSVIGYEADTIPTKKNDAMIATKVDYYIASLLLDGRIESDNKVLTERQLRIFKAIERWNVGKLGGIFVNMDNVVEKLAAIARNSNTWTDRENIFTEVNKDRQNFVPLSTINNDLQVLMSMNIIERQKPPRKNKFGYFILTPNAGAAIMLPHPSEIIDPVYEGKKVKVVNPLTGQIEEI